MTEPPQGPPRWSPPPPSAPFQVGGALNWAFQKFGQHWQVLVVGMLPAVLVGIGFYAGYLALFLPVWLNGVEGETTSNAAMLDLFQRIGLLYAGLLLLKIPLSVVHANLVRAALMIADGETPTMRMLVSTRRAGRIMLTSFVLLLCTLVGMVLCYLPGLAFSAFAFFTLPFLLDQDLKTWAAIKASFSLVRAHLGISLLTALVVVVITSVGSMACLVGLVASVPIGLLAQVYAYRALTHGRVVP
ncbi:hypothetical protein [Aeromicrobium sp. NPDC092404]|uniref:hypothetical protein n=1 Tax=Aeromicrobium sp. NPDC092404 TaxID=3154976 RepID=UPI0034489019